jgi:S-DNA-T family DNA segregation ATPase FtsK/SpoIIIE
VIVNSGLELSRALELVGNLKHTVSDFAKREDQLIRSQQSRRIAVNRKFHESLRQQDGFFAQQSAHIEALFDEQERRVRTSFETRRERVERYSYQAMRGLPKCAKEAREHWLASLQMQLVGAEKTRATDLKTIDTAFAECSARLTELRVNLVRLNREARRALNPFPFFLRVLRKENLETAVADKENENLTLESIQADLSSAEQQLTVFQRYFLARVFRYLPVSFLAVACFLAGVALATKLGLDAGAYLAGSVCSLVLLCAVFILYRIGRQQSQTTALALAVILRRANHAYEWLRIHYTKKHEQDCQTIEQTFERTHAEIAEQWNLAGDVEADFETRMRKKLETQAPRVSEQLQKLLAPKIERIQTTRKLELTELENENTTLLEDFSNAHESNLQQLSDTEQNEWDALQRDWQSAILPICQEIEAMNATAVTRFPEWSNQLIETWRPPTNFAAAAKFARLDLEIARLAEALPHDPRFALPASSKLSLPLALTFPSQGSLLCETKESCGAFTSRILNNIVLRLLEATPPGKVAFTIIDPIGLGQNFAGLMHLSDYEESLINRRIWTQHNQIEERLAELNEHIEKVIQMYLRDEYATITDYNAQAGSVAEKYHFLVIADFPAGFSETAARRLQSIATSGPRCGVFTLVHWDQRQTLPDGFAADDLRRSSVCIRREKGGFVLDKRLSEAGVMLIPDDPPDAETAASLVHKIGRSSVDSNRVEVPFSQIAPKADEMWTHETTSELKVAIGRTGATKLQYLAIGKGTRQHALFAGKTGSGKSTLFHVIITNLALTCSPAQVEFYLIDFKKGVEFKCYADRSLPHARVVAIESDREFALSVLQRIDEELKRRGDLFRKHGAQDLAGYKKTGGLEPIPRTLLIIDEFQEFFVQDDTIAQTASLLFDRIVRQGRAFGIHVLLGSQTLGGAYTLARATLGQMVIRVALQCNEADAYLIMDDNNSAPRLLSRPGEGIYNDAAGAVEGNSPFQVVWLPDEERDQWLDKVHQIAQARGSDFSAPIVFEGNAPADIRDNELLRTALDVQPSIPPPFSRCWLGAPNSIKGPTEASFYRQSGNNLLIVGQRDDTAFTMLTVSLLALAAHYPPGKAKFFFLSSVAVDSPGAILLKHVTDMIPHPVTIAQSHDVAALINRISAQLKSRISGEEKQDNEETVFLFIHGLHKYKKLRHEEDFSFSMNHADAAGNPSEQFNELIRECSAHGFHILASLDTFNNVNRFISRKALGEFEMRVVFQMSANDSASLIDSPKASALGLHRAIFYNEREGTLETFRPYASPAREWLQQLTVRRSSRRLRNDPSAISKRELSV